MLSSSLKVLGFSKRGESVLAENRVAIFGALITNNYKLSTNQGFSLIELIVSMGLFTLGLTVALGSLAVLIDVNAKARNMQEVMTNLNFGIDSMAREIRTGRGYYCSNSDFDGDLDKNSVNDCASGKYFSIVEGGDSLTTGETSQRISYRYNDQSLAIDRRIADNGWFPITSHEIDITEMYFSVEDSETGLNGDVEQANVTIYIAGHAGELVTVDSSFELQTTITKRILDI